MDEMKSRVSALINSKETGVAVMDAMKATGLDYLNLMGVVRSLCEDGAKIGMINAGSGVTRLYPVTDRAALQG